MEERTADSIPTGSVARISAASAGLADGTIGGDGISAVFNCDARGPLPCTDFADEVIE
jgi:hypothetical protein